MGMSVTGAFVKAGSTKDFADGTKKKVIINGHEIMLARVGNEYYAIQNRCPHMGGDLSMGTLNGMVITCPRHGSQFNIGNGQVIRWTNWTGITKTLSQAFKSPRPVKTFKVKLDKGDILVET